VIGTFVLLASSDEQDHVSSRSALLGLLSDRLFCILIILVAIVKRSRQGSCSPSPAQNDLSRVVDEQAALIESLKKEKAVVVASMASLKSDHERTCKENVVLRKAINIQQERLNQAEGHVKAGQEYRAEAEDRIKKLEQVILSLRYHLQTQQSYVGNDFMNHPRPPDVY
jgi:hypothetical protein